MRSHTKALPVRPQQYGVAVSDCLISATQLCLKALLACQALHALNPLKEAREKRINTRHEPCEAVQY